MIRESLLRYSIVNGTIHPHFLDERDHPWLRLLIQEYERFIGRKRHELALRWKEPLPFASPEKKRILALHVLDKISQDQTHSVISPKIARAQIFTQAAGLAMDSSQNSPRYTDESRRQIILNQVAQQLNVSVLDLEKSLFADLPHERTIGEFTEALTPERLALQSNLLLVQGILFRATAIDLHIFGVARPIVRHAKFRGLICTAHKGEGDGSLLKISGPLSLFRLTLIYGRHLAELAPILLWTNNFDLKAECILKNKTLQFRMQPGMPIAPSKMPRAFDSLVEEKFYRDFMKATTEWDLVREPEPIESLKTLIFPDFQIKNRKDPSQIWFIEIIGFWTPEYLSNKFKKLKEVHITNIILCIDATKNCTDSDLPAGAKIIRYKKKINPMEVLNVASRK